MTEDNPHHVENIDPTKRTSELVGDTVEAVHEPGVCYYNGAKYSEGAYICERGQKMRCKEGRWEPQGAC